MVSIDKFKIESDNERYDNYLNNYLFKYVDNVNILYDHLIVRENKEYGLKVNKDKIICIVPKIKTLFDEMVSIHEISHLIHEMKNSYYLDYKTREIIPFFNEYNYLLLTDKNLAEEYLNFRKELSEEFIKKDCDDDINLGYIYAYLVLKKRKDNYDIDYLNKVNSKENKLEKKLKLKRYTV